MLLRKLFIIFGTVAAFTMAVVIIIWMIWIPAPRETEYYFEQAWGEKGSAPGQFNDPTGIAVNQTEVFVSDARNGRIQVFDYNGGFKRQFGNKGRGQLGRPMNLTIYGNELYVADYWNDNIQVFSLDGSFLRSIGKPGSGPGELNAPGGVAVVSDGSLFVADFYNQRIQHLKADGSFIKQWGKTGETGIGAGEFNYPTDIAVGSNGNLYIADGYNDRIQVLSSAGKFLHKWGGPFALNIYGPFAGWFATVTSVAIGPSNNVFAADFYNNRIQKFSADGTFLTSFGHVGSGPGQFQHVVAVAVADNGTVFAADYVNNRIQKWRPGTP
jgi:NHL repeat/6-bladed beta-propeller